MTVYYEDPTQLTRVVEYAVPEEELRAYEERAEGVRQALLDGHVARGAISRDECPKWNAHLMREFDLARDVLEDLPSNEQLAERAFEEDPRLRSLIRQHLAHLGIEKEPVEYETDDRSAEEKLTDQLLGVLKTGAAR